MLLAPRACHLGTEEGSGGLYRSHALQKLKGDVLTSNLGGRNGIKF
jgi:hypothetical protein